MVEISFSLNVIVVPSIDSEIDQHYNRSDGDLIVKVRRTLQLHCNAYGYPEPTISWFKDDKPIEKIWRDSLYLSLDRQLFNVMDVQLNDSGKYSCVARNQAGHTEKSFSVKVTGELIIFQNIRKLIKKYSQFPHNGVRGRSGRFATPLAVSDIKSERESANISAMSISILRIK
jgi:hypothetical protein